MGYQAVLFCPDEKLARVVSQVFSEVDFVVDIVSEPFTAVKKVMARHYDAIVVDCDNEQNSALLFKSARSSSFNQNSLAIALVEGQAGVAKAYRIGANLVLTKPINVEQAKGTLRVARGLLRKSGDAAAAASAMTRSVAAKEPGSSAFPVEHAAENEPVTASTTYSSTPEFATAVPAGSFVNVLRPTMSASVKAKETPAEEMSASQTPAAHMPPAHTPAAQIATPAAAESSAASEAAAFEESAVHEEAKAELFIPSAPPVPVRNAGSSRQAGAAAGAAAAPAPAQDTAAKPGQRNAAAKEEVLDKPKDLTNAVLVGRQEPSFTASVTELPSFAAFAEPDDDQSGSGKKILIVAIAILALALVAYFAWSEFSGYHSSAVSHPAITTAQQEQQNGPNSELGAASTAAAAPLPANKVARANPSKPAVASNTSQSQSGRPSPSAATERIELSIEPGAKQSGVAPMLVKPGIPAPADTGETTVQQPPSLAAADSPDNSKLSGLITSEQNVAKPTLAQIKVSQGVSQGLLIKRVQPKYPARALASHVQGAVEIEATIDKEGNVVSPKVLSGDAMLAGAAVEAVRQWRYKPYYLNGEPVEIQTQITIHFKGN